MAKWGHRWNTDQTPIELLCDIDPEGQRRSGFSVMRSRIHCKSFSALKLRSEVRAFQRTVYPRILRGLSLRNRAGMRAQLLPLPLAVRPVRTGAATE